MMSLILLAAGESFRFGSPKALAEYQGRRIIENLQRTLLASKLDEIIVVLGAHCDQIKPHVLNHKKIKVVYNKDHKFGQTSSVKTGLNAISPTTEATGLLPVDFPCVKTETIDRLIDVFIKIKPAILIPTCGGKKGHPPFFHNKLTPQFLSLPDDHGVNTAVRQHVKEIVLLPVSDLGVLLSFNTPEELETIQKSFPTAPES
jgi:molybdenum cofactor cytidylyltransferase